MSGNNRARTYDPLLVRLMLSQLSYAPPLLRNGSPRGTSDIIADYPGFVNLFSKKYFANGKYRRNTALPLKENGKCGKLFPTFEGGSL